jgi:hypothetical protein
MENMLKHCHFSIPPGAFHSGKKSLSHQTGLSKGGVRVFSHHQKVEIADAQKKFSLIQHSGVSSAIFPPAFLSGFVLSPNTVSVQKTEIGG